MSWHMVRNASPTLVLEGIVINKPTKEEQNKNASVCLCQWSMLFFLASCCGLCSFSVFNLPSKCNRKLQCDQVKHRMTRWTFNWVTHIMHRFYRLKPGYFMVKFYYRKKWQVCSYKRFPTIIHGHLAQGDGQEHDDTRSQLILLSSEAKLFQQPHVTRALKKFLSIVNQIVQSTNNHQRVRLFSYHIIVSVNILLTARWTHGGSVMPVKYAFKSHSMSSITINAWKRKSIAMRLKNIEIQELVKKARPNLKECSSCEASHTQCESHTVCEIWELCHWYNKMSFRRKVKVKDIRKGRESRLEKGSEVLAATENHKCPQPLENRSGYLQQTCTSWRLTLYPVCFPNSRYKVVSLHIAILHCYQSFTSWQLPSSVCFAQVDLTGDRSDITPYSSTTLLCLNCPMMAASWRNFESSCGEQSSFRVLINASNCKVPAAFCCDTS